MKWIAGMPAIHFFYFCAAKNFPTSLSRRKKFQTFFDGRVTFSEDGIKGQGKFLIPTLKLHLLNFLNSLQNEFR